MANNGYEFSRRELLTLTADFAAHSGMCGVEKVLSLDWLYGFIVRTGITAGLVPASSVHSENQAVANYNHSEKCSQACTEENFRQYFLRLGRCLEAHRLRNQMDRIYNVDEVALSHQYKPNKIVHKRGVFCQEVSAWKGRIVTLICCGSAAGHVVPPYSILPGLLPGHTVSPPPGTNTTMSETGWSTADIFFNWLSNHFLPNLPVPPTEQEPVLLIYNGHKSHVNMTTLSWAVRHHIVLFVIPAYTSHFLQPLSVACFAPLEESYTKRKSALKKTRPSGKLAFIDLAQLGCAAYTEAMTVANLQSAFRTTGIVPFTGIYYST